MSRRATIGGDLLDELERLFEEDAVGKANSLTSSQIASRTGISDGEANPKTREAIRALVEEREIPVAAGSCGYWRLQSADEYWSYQETLQGRIDGIQERRQLVAEAWSGGLVADGGERP